jgi:hypothetical protein
MSHPVFRDRNEPSLTNDEEWLLLDDDYRSGLFRMAMTGGRFKPGLSLPEALHKIWQSLVRIPRTVMRVFHEDKVRRVRRELLLRGVSYDRASKTVT